VYLSAYHNAPQHLNRIHLYLQLSMAQKVTSRIIDACYSTNNSAGRDHITIDYTIPQVESGPSSQPSLSFNDAPIDLLSRHFTGREVELDRIERVFSMGHGDAPTHCVLYGMSGIGKTQLALQYAILSYKQQQYYIVFWMSGTTVEKLNQGLTKVLALVGHPDHDHWQDQATKLTLARHWLEENGPIRWLLVLDNIALDTDNFLRQHLPCKNSLGNILLTTWIGVVAEAMASVAGKQHQFLELHAPDLQDAAKQLLVEAGIDTSDTMSASEDGAGTLIKCSGCLPLAISHAASFAKQSHKNLDNVLGLYQSKHKYEVSFYPQILSFCICLWFLDSES
jgi:hypothetical protein